MIRALSDGVHRDILAAPHAARLGTASGADAVVEMPPLTIRNVSA